MKKKIVLNRSAGLIGLIALLAIAGLSAFAGDWLKERLLTLYQDKELCLLILAVLFTLFAWFLMEATNGRWVIFILLMAYVSLYITAQTKTGSVVWAIASLVITTIVGLFAMMLATDTRSHG